MDTYRLDWAELSMVAQLGMLRHMRGVYKGYADQDGLDTRDGRGWGLHIEGAAGEYVVAKVLGITNEPGIQHFRQGGDLAGFIDVKTRFYTGENLFLLLSARANPDSAYVLVTGLAPAYTIHGWAWGNEIKQACYRQDLRNGRPVVYGMPVTHLQPLARLRRLVLERSFQRLESEYGPAFSPTHAG